MNILFAGTPAFAAAALDALLQAGHRVPLVLTQPDRPAGRGLKPQASAVKQMALSKQLSVAQPATLNDDAVIAQLAAVGADAMVVAAYGLILPESLLRLPRLGCLNIHASLLPRWRGAAPIQRAILAADRETGVTIMQMDAGLDTGAILLEQAIPIADDDNAQTLHDKLAALGAQLIVRVLHEQPAAVPQDHARASYAAKITKAEARIDWNRPAAELARAIRAYNPMPGAYTTWQGQPLKLWRAEPVSAASAVPGTVLLANADGIVVATGDGALRLLELQRAGGKRLAAASFLTGAALQPGERLDV